jgi:hypothetical protein
VRQDRPRDRDGGAPPAALAPDQLRALLLGAEDGTLDEAGWARLEAALAADPRARQALRMHVLVSGELRQRLRAPARPPSRRPARAATAAALVLVLGAGGAFAWWATRERRGASEAPAHATARPDEAALPRFAPGPRPAPPRPAGHDDASPAPASPRAEALARAARPAGPGWHPFLKEASPVDLELLRMAGPNAAGLMLENKHGFRCAGHQVFAMNTLMAGAELGRPRWIDEGRRAARATVAAQDPRGDWPGGVFCSALWLAGAIVAIDTAEAARPGAIPAADAAALGASILRAAAWLEEGATIARLFPERPHMTADLVGASALAAVASRTNSVVLRNAALALADQALARQRADGALTYAAEAPDGGPPAAADVWKNAKDIVNLHRLVTYAADERLVDAARRAGRWLAAQVRPDGAFDITPSTTSACTTSARGCARLASRDVHQALLLHGLRFGDEQALRLLPALRRRVAP